MTQETILLAFVILAGLYIAWNIGANDVANAMGTSVGSGALTLRQAVMIAAVLEFAGAFLFGSHVSETIQSGIVDSAVFKDPIIIVYGMLASLLSAGIWLQVASYYGWPVSTTHTIVGAVVGFGVVAGGIDAVYWENVSFIATSWVLSPVIGGILSYAIFSYLRMKIFYAQEPVRAAKKITPPICFGVLFVLSLIMLYKGLSNVELKLNFFESFIVSSFVGAIGYLIAKLCLRNVDVKPTSEDVEQYHPELSRELDKARKHLLQVQAAAKGSLLYQVTDLIESVGNVNDTLKVHSSKGHESEEYALVEKIFGYLQIMSACLMAFAHGANDVANAIGPLSAAITILTTGVITANTAVPTWALALGGVGIVVGLATWGWRVIETIGKKITELTPTRGFSAEFGAAATILVASRLGLPVSTTHTLVGSVIGVGLARGIEALDLRTTKFIFVSWLVTVPAGALLTVGLYEMIKYIAQRF
jgi:phosphate/sulfate permease